MAPRSLTAASVRPLMLSILSEGESYGYAILQRIHDLSDGQVEWSDGTLYPVLHRLELEGLVSSRWSRSSGGRRRKYYALTARGADALAVERREWMTVHEMLAALWSNEPAT